jgi:hypothetical protein
LLVLSACEGDPVKGDAPTDIVVPRCNPAAPFGIPALVGGINSDADDLSARFSADELVVVFGRRRPSGVFDLFTATRPDRDAPFGAVSLMASVNSVNSDVWPTLSPDGLLLLFDSDRSTAIFHIYTSRRAAVTDSFAAATPAVALMDREVHPMLANGRALYFASAERPGQGTSDLWRAEIDSTGATSAPVALVGGVNSADAEDAPALTQDETQLYFRRTAGIESDIYAASRSTAQDGFGAAAPVAGLAVAGLRETPTWISPDGCVLYVAMTQPVPTGMGGDDIYVVRRGS